MEKAVDFGMAIIFAIAAVAGASGSCLIVAHRILKGRNISALLMMAYAFVGAVLAVAMIAYMRVFTSVIMNPEEIILCGIGIGVTGSAALAAVNFGTRILMKWRGIEIEVRLKDEGKNGEDRKQ